MARFAFVTWDGGGNASPAIGIAQELRLRGHDAIFAGYETQRKRFEAQEFDFITLRRSGSFDIYHPRRVAERIPFIANVWACPAHLEDIPDAVEETCADALIIDFMMQGALAAARRLSMPVAVLAHSSIAGLTPPPESSLGGRLLAVTNRLREEAGLSALTRLNDGWAGQPALVTTIPELDPAATDAGALVRYVGPIFERFPDMDWNSPWEAGDDCPLVLVSFTTTGLWDQRGRIRNTLDAICDEPVRVLVTAADPGDIGAIPANAVIRQFVPHAAVLPAAAVTVTHAGHGTESASLAYGVPIVALPNASADQPFLAATLQRLGAGLALDGESEPEAVRSAVRAIMTQPSYATVAKTLAAAIHAAPGINGATAELERLALAARS
ncbi:MAG TPA: nucleotide disphospho-sugar-binding domain-containing protein [Ktedonobacterales bacterium]|jgi:MGT family glycosyltransferase|nr:nucleotide disphospho-sugar-binding domain-containing protein [Ktedonobacterales bacterium]